MPLTKDEQYAVENYSTYFGPSGLGVVKDNTLHF